MRKQDLKALLKQFRSLHQTPLTGLTKLDCEDLILQILEDILQHLEALSQDGRKQRQFELKGAGFGDFLRKVASKASEFAKKVVEKVKQVAPNFKTVYQLVGNIWRSRNCDGKARPLEFGELHYGCHNYTGPGTRMDLHPSTKPYNGIDACSKKHDEDYGEAARASDPIERARLVRKADEDAVACYDRHASEDGYEAARLGIQGKLNAEKLLSLYKGEPSTFYGGRVVKGVRYLK